jgi:NDP-sugar pyrophosphorylase family protein
MDNIWINAGIYYFTKRIFDQLPEAGGFEVLALPLLILEQIRVPS